METTELNCEQCEDQLFDFHEGRLSPEQSASIDQHLKQCNACSQLLNDIWQMSLVSTRWQDESVPNWQRDSHFAKSGWQFPQTLATAASLLALVLVLTDVHFVSSNDGLTLRMGRNNYLSKVDVEALKAEQKNYLDESIQQLTSQQSETNQLLLRTMLQSTRQERKEDFSTLVSYWNSVQAKQQEETDENLRYLLATQAEDERDIQQLSAALQQIGTRRGTDM